MLISQAFDELVVLRNLDTDPDRRSIWGECSLVVWITLSTSPALGFEASASAVERSSAERETVVTPRTIGRAKKVRSQIGRK